MKIIVPICASLLWPAAFVHAALILTTGVPANSLLASPAQASPNLGVRFTFDALAPNSTFSPSTYASYGLTITSPDGLLVEPFSTQTFPNELFDNSPNGTANISIQLTRATSAIGVGIADSDPVMVTLQALNMSGAGFGSVFTVNVNAGSMANPGNGYYVVSDNANDIYGLQILQTAASPNYSGLAIDDVQYTPEPGSLGLLMLGSAVLAGLRFRMKALRGR